MKNMKLSVVLVALSVFLSTSVGLSIMVTLRNSDSLSLLEEAIGKQNIVLDGQHALIAGQQGLLTEYARMLSDLEGKAGILVLSPEDRRLLFREIREQTGSRLESIERELETLEARQNSRFAAIEAALTGLGGESSTYYRRLEQRLQSLQSNLSVILAWQASADAATESLPPTILASEYRHFGEKSRDEGDYGEAAEYFRRSAEYESTTETLLNYAHSLYSADPAVRKDSEIVSSVLTVLDRDPVNSDALTLLGNLYLEQGKLDDAMPCYERLVSLDPENGPARKRLGEIYLSIADFENAIRQLTTAGDLLPDDPMVYYELGQAYFSLGRYTEAESAHSDALSARIGFPPALLGRGKSRSALGLLEMAAEDISAYVRRRPKDFGALVELGDLNERMGAHAEALKYWERARVSLSLNSDEDRLRWRDVSRREARLCLSLGDYRGTIFYVEKGLELAHDTALLKMGMEAAETIGDEGLQQKYGRQIAASEGRAQSE